jgi:hypothetical protein
MKTAFFVGFAGVLAVSGATGARADDASALSTPPLVLSLTPGTGGGPWRLRIENTGDVPVRIATDSRLLVLEVTAPAGSVAKPVRCALPEDARPATDEGHDLVVPSKRSWSAIVDPLLYCFVARERATLVTGATVTAHFGWPAPTPKSAAKAAAARAPAKPVVLTSPFVAAPVGAAVGKLAPAKELVGTAVTLTENVLAAAPSAAAAASLVVSMPESLDVARGNEIATTVTLSNEGDKAAVLLFRPEMFRFNVAGPAGSVACGMTRAVDAPIRELYSTIAPKGRASLGVLVTALCPSDTFDDPGIYRITAVLDTSAASGRAIGLKTWDGEVEARAPMLLRVRTPRRQPTATTRPALD